MSTVDQLDIQAVGFQQVNQIRQRSDVDSAVTFSIPNATRLVASSVTRGSWPPHSKSLLTRLPGVAARGTRVHTLPACLATSRQDPLKDLLMLLIEDLFRLCH